MLDDDPLPPPAGSGAATQRRRSKDPFEFSESSALDSGPSVYPSVTQGGGDETAKGWGALGGGGRVSGGPVGGGPPPDPDPEESDKDANIGRLYSSRCSLLISMFNSFSLLLNKLLSLCSHEIEEKKYGLNDECEILIARLCRLTMRMIAGYRKLAGLSDVVWV